MYLHVTHGTISRLGQLGYCDALASVVEFDARGDNSMGRDAQPLLRINPHCSGRRAWTTLSHLCNLAVFVSSTFVYGSRLLAQNESAARKLDAPDAPQICLGQNSHEEERLSLKHAIQTDEALQGEPAGPQRLRPMATMHTERDDHDSDLAEVQSPLRCVRQKHQQAPDTHSTASSASAQEDPSQPSVRYSEGVLTVIPHNAPMGQVLQAVQRATGFVLDYHPANESARVFDQVGPLPLREALVQLLYGSGFNYIIQTAAKDPREVTRVYVSPQNAPPATETAAVPPSSSEDSIEGQNLYGGFGETTAEEPPAPPIAPVMRGTPSSGGNVPGVPSDFNLKQAAQDAKKTPGEILDELQKRQLEILDAQSPPQ